MQTAAALFRAYAAELGVDLEFQGFEAELAGLPGKYAPPAGELLLAVRPDGAAWGCVALRTLGGYPGCCEMKRLYVASAGRGSGVGRALAEAIMAAARALGYREMRLDTLARLEAAIRLYRELEFVDIAPYYDNPLPGVRFLGRSL
jgi:ribosomal protein S18 acetylase RimI-like enzyme